MISQITLRNFWGFSIIFDSCVNEKKSLSILVNRFCGKPFGMRAGVLPILLAYSLSKRNEDIIVPYIFINIWMMKNILEL